MYSYIKGEIVEILEDVIVVENQGIGYNIRIPGSLHSALEGIGQYVKIYTYTYIREDAMLLYGFLTRDDLNVFKLLLGVSGIGPKGALAILSVMTPDDLRFAILAQDENAIAKAPGIGKKSAQRLIIELKDKMSFEEAVLLKNEHDSGNVQMKVQDTSAKHDAVSALVALGYSSGEALRIVNGLTIESDTSVEDILKMALKQMSFL